NTMVDDPAAAHEELPRDVPDRTAETLEQRVHRLEDAVAALQDTHLMEDRIIDRVVHRLNRGPAKDATGIVDAERRTTAPPPSPHGPAPEPPAAGLPQPSLSVKPGWLFVEVFSELRAMIGMFFDYRFRPAWGAYVSIIVIIAVLVSHWWLPLSNVPVVGDVF